MSLFPLSHMLYVFQAAFFFFTGFVVEIFGHEIGDFAGHPELREETAGKTFSANLRLFRAFWTLFRLITSLPEVNLPVFEREHILHRSRSSEKYIQNLTKT